MLLTFYLDENVVRVGEDILLLNAMTGLVIDAIEHIFQ
ncbi:MAG: hypothetical protein ACI87C_002120 [Paraperlucidibaca sp.]|jgi:hypothetical protein|tara:strand:+ start:6264 stop:6377 length:114 start_codon:yes stop_codon:yes gene_type:complete